MRFAVLFAGGGSTSTVQCTLRASRQRGSGRKFMQSTFFAWARLDFRHSARATSARLGLRKPSCVSTSTSALALAGTSRTRLLRLSGAVRCALLSITDTPVGIKLAAVALTVRCSAYNGTTLGFGCWPAPRACSRWHRCGGLHVQCCFALRR